MLASFLQHTTLVESNEDLKTALSKLGYAKMADSTSTRVFVYVGGAERKATLANIVDKMPGAWLDTSSAGVKSGGSLGVIRFKQGAFQNN